MVLFLSLAGIPPLVGFWAKFNLFAAVLTGFLRRGSVHAGGAGGGMSAVSLYYYLQVLKRVYVMPAVDETPIAAYPITMGVLILIALAVVVLGMPARAAAVVDRGILRQASGAPNHGQQASRCTDSK